MDIDEALDEIDAALEQGEHDRAARLAAKAVRRFSDSPEAWSLMGEALEGLCDLPGAVQAFTKSLELDPEWASGHAHMANLLLELDRIPAAFESVEKAMDQDALDPEANYTFAMLCEISGEGSTAARFYAAAAQLDPERYPPPVRVPLDRFESMAREALEDLPEKVRTFIGDVPVIVQDLPERDGSGRLACGSPLLLGECIGDHREDAGALDPVSLTPPRILLYKLNLERTCTEPDELAEQVRITVLHEILHFLGMDEQEVGGRGLG